MNKQMNGHILKIDSNFFADLITNRKKSEIRFNDRDFKVGDCLDLQEYCKKSGIQTGRGSYRLITNIVTHDDFPDGLKPGYCVLSLEQLPYEIWRNLEIVWRGGTGMEAVA